MSLRWTDKMNSAYPNIVTPIQARCGEVNQYDEYRARESEYLFFAPITGTSTAAEIGSLCILACNLDLTPTTRRPNLCWDRYCPRQRP